MTGNLSVLASAIFGFTATSYAEQDDLLALGDRVYDDAGNMIETRGRGLGGLAQGFFRSWKAFLI